MFCWNISWSKSLLFLKSAHYYSPYKAQLYYKLILQWRIDQDVQFRPYLENCQRVD